MPSTRSSVRLGTGMLALALLVVACTGSVAAAPDDGRPHHIGILRSVPDVTHSILRDELRAQGWHGTRDLRLSPAGPDEVYEDVEDARAVLRSWHEDEPLSLVLAFSTPYAQLAAEELPDVPVLFMVNDPVAGGLVDDPEEPDGRITGVSFWTPADRTLALASRVVAGIDRLGYLWPEDDPAVPGHRDGILAAAEAAGVEVLSVSFDEQHAGSVPTAVDQLADAEVDAVWLASSNATVRMLDEIEAQLDAQRIPAIANTSVAEFAVLVVMPDTDQLRRQLARQAARVLAGTPITSVPVEDPRRFVTIINRTRAEELGLPELDQALLRQADLVR